MEYATTPDTPDTTEGEALPFLLQLAQAEANITPLLESTAIAEIGEQVCEQYERDKQSREGWEVVAEKALSDMAKCDYGDKDYPWPGASNVHYPLLTQAVMQFNARAYPAIVKGDAAVNVKVVGADAGLPIIGPDGQPVMQVQGLPVVMTPQGAAVLTPQGAQPLPDGVQPQPVWQREPGAKVRRIMARTHAGKSGMAATAGVAALAGAANVQAGRKRDTKVRKALQYNGPGQAPSEIIKRGPYAPPEGHRDDVTADLSTNAKTNQAYVKRMRLWKKRDRAGQRPNKSAGPIVRARAAWRKKTFTPLEQKRNRAEQGARDVKIRRDLAEQYRNDDHLSPAQKQLKEFDSGKRITPEHLRPSGFTVQKRLKYQGPGRPPVERLEWVA